MFVESGNIGLSLGLCPRFILSLAQRLDRFRAIHDGAKRLFALLRHRGDDFGRFDLFDDLPRKAASISARVNETESLE